MAGRRLGPIAFIAALAGLYIAGDRLENYGFAPNIGCAYDLARLDRPAPDLLFLGNSRTGAAIDPVYVARRIDGRGRNRPTVERIAMTSPDTAAATVLARTYLSHRGAPDVVVLQLMYERDLDDLRKIGTPIHAPRSIAYGGLADLYHVQASARLSPVEHGLPRWLQPGYRPFAGVMLDKAITNIYSALEAPDRWLSGEAHRCDGDRLFGQSLLWVYDENWSAGPVTPKPASPSSVATWLRTVSEYVPIDPADPVRQFENHQLHELIELFERHGSKVLLMHFPTFGQPIPDEGVSALAAEFSDNRLIDISGYFAKVTAGNEAGYFRDEDHVNHAGAILISRFLADVLTAMIE